MKAKTEKQPSRGTPDFLLLFLTFSLVCFGLVMVFSATSMTFAYYNLDPFSQVKKQALAVAMGIVGMLFCMNLRFTFFKKWAVPILLMSITLLVAVIFVGTGPEGTGIKSWFNVGPLAFQPVELAKLAIILYLATIITKKEEKFREFKNGLLPALLMILFVSALIMKQPDLGSCAILVMGAMVVIMVGGANMKHILLLGSGGAAVGGIALSVYLLNRDPLKTDYRLDRFTAFMDPWANAQDTGYHLVQSLYAFGHGGVWGAGFGKGIQKLFYIPEAHNDFIFAIIAEELGFIGSALFLLVYIVFIWRGIVVALRCPDLFGTLVGVGIMAMFAIQAFINIGGVSGAIPITGVTLPFISYGGSSMLVSLVSMGVLLSISRSNYTPVTKENKRR